MNASVKLRPELKDLPRRIQELPVDSRGYPVPWFVAWIDGAPEFRVADNKKWVAAVRDRRCWVCGQPLGAYLCFVLGPMCGINRTTSEPPCHQQCAEWSAVNCPFLSRPHMVRREDAMIEALNGNSAGLPLKRNPGVTLLWTTRNYRVFDDGAGRPLIRIADPTGVKWYAEGRPATRAEVEASVDSGLPKLRELAVQQRGGLEALEKMTAAFRHLLPDPETVAAP